MADESRDVGIKLSLMLGQAKKSLDGLRTAASAGGKAMEKAGAAGAAAFRAAGMGIVVLNQALELAKKGMEIFQLVVLDSVEKALEFRNANDQMANRMRAVRREAELVRARFGDALIPAIVGVSEAFWKATGRLSDYISKNREAIGVGIVEWLADTARLLISVVIPAIQGMSTAWLGVKTVVLGLAGVVNEFVGRTIEGLGKINRVGATIARAFGAEGIASAIGAASDSVEAYGRMWRATADKQFADIKQTAVDTQGLIGRLNSFRSTTLGAIEAGVAATIDAIKTAGEGGSRTVEEAAERAQKALGRLQAANERIDAFVAARAASQDRDADRFEADAKAFEAAESAKVAASSESAASIAANAASVATAFGAAAGASLAAGDAMSEVVENAQIAMLTAIIQSAEAAIMAYAAQAAAKAFAESAFIPGIGLIAGAAMAATVGAAVRGYIGQLPRMAEGGIVRGGMPGVDSVPALLMPGEAVLSVDATRRLLDLTQYVAQMVPQGGGGFARGNLVASGGRGAQSVTVNLSPTFQMLEAPTQSSQLKIISDLAQGIQQAVRDGIIELPGVA